MPGEHDLPPSIAELAYRNGIEVRSGQHFSGDMEQLIRRLTPILGTAAPTPAAPVAPPPPRYPLPDVPARLASLGFQGVNPSGIPAIVPIQPTTKQSSAAQSLTPHIPLRQPDSEQSTLPNRAPAQSNLDSRPSSSSTIEGTSQPTSHPPESSLSRPVIPRSSLSTPDDINKTSNTAELVHRPRDGKLMQTTASAEISAGMDSTNKTTSQEGFADSASQPRVAPRGWDDYTWDSADEPDDAHWNLVGDLRGSLDADIVTESLSVLAQLGAVSRPITRLARIRLLLRRRPAAAAMLAMFLCCSVVFISGGSLEIAQLVLGARVWWQLFLVLGVSLLAGFLAILAIIALLRTGYGPFLRALLPRWMRRKVADPAPQPTLRYQPRANGPETGFDIYAESPSPRGSRRPAPRDE